MAQALENELDATLVKLNSALRYWQTWEAEYEGFKEELEAEDPEPHSQRMIEIAEEYGSNIIDEAEIKTIVNFNKSSLRDRSQVINVIKDRMDTARKNIASIIQQIENKEAQVTPATRAGVAKKSDLIEVTEELDEDDNIVSSKVENFDKAVEEMTKALKNHSVADPKIPAPQEKSGSDVSIAETTATAHLNHHTPITTISLGKPKVLVAGKVKDLDLVSDEEAAAEITSYSDDHALAQDIRNNLNDLGPIVAELDLEEEDDSLEEEWDEEDDLEENEYGMTSIRDQMDKDYIKEMEALAKKHGMRNLGPDPALLASIVPKTVLKKPAVKIGDVIDSQRPDDKLKISKGVRFAENLDISSHSETVTSPENHEEGAPQPVKTMSAPLGDVIEKSFSVAQPPIAHPSAPGKRASRFKSAKNANLGLQGAAARQTKHEDIVIPEKETDRDELSLTDEFGLYSRRMKAAGNAIDRSLFGRDAESQEDESMSEPQPKMSRFKAARLGL